MRVDPDSLPTTLVASAAAQIFHRSRRRILQLCHAGKLPGARKFFGRWEIPTFSLITFFSSPRDRGGRPKRLALARKEVDFHLG